jgi:hypothetical protein
MQMQSECVQLDHWTVADLWPLCSAPLFPHPQPPARPPPPAAMTDVAYAPSYEFEQQQQQ